MKIVVVTGSKNQRIKFFLERNTPKNIEIVYFSDKDHLVDYSNSINENCIIISFLSGIIVPKLILDKAKLVINIHPAPPSYPGRDPHHFAIFNKEKNYGVTAHLMEPSVDSGKIIAIKNFTIPKNITPSKLHEISVEYSYILLEELLPQILKNNNLADMCFPRIHWGNIKYTRKMFLNMCIIESPINLEEISWRLFCFQVKGYPGLKIKINSKWYSISEF